MTVKDLIEELRQFPETAVVVTYDREFCEYYDVDSVREQPSEEVLARAGTGLNASADNRFVLIV